MAVKLAIVGDFAISRYFLRIITDAVDALNHYAQWLTCVYVSIRCDYGVFGLLLPLVAVETTIGAPWSDQFSSEVKIARSTLRLLQDISLISSKSASACPKIPKIEDSYVPIFHR